MIGEVLPEMGLLSSDLAFEEFLRTRKAWKVRMELPERQKLSRRESRVAVYESETERLRGVLRLAARANQHERERTEPTKGNTNG